MAERGTKRRSRAALIALAAIAGVLVLGYWLGQRQEATLEPCERYARQVRTALDNCHSGVNRDYAFHESQCEASIDVTDACLEEIERLSRVACDELERQVSSRQLCR